MLPEIGEREPVMAGDEEQSEIERIEEALLEGNATDGDGQSVTITLSRPGHESTLELPATVAQLLFRVVHLLAHGEAVSVVPVHKELTTRQAAELLNVSRQYLVRLLDAGDIPFHYTGTHRRIRFGDLMDYKQIRDQKRRKGLAQLTRMSQELGLYQ